MLRKRIFRVCFCWGFAAGWCDTKVLLARYDIIYLPTNQVCVEKIQIGSGCEFDGTFSQGSSQKKEMFAKKKFCTEIFLVLRYARASDQVTRFPLSPFIFWFPSSKLVKRSSKFPILTQMWHWQVCFWFCLPRTLWEKGEKENQPSHVTWLCLSPCNRSQITLIAHSWSRAALSFRLGGFVIFSMISGSFLLLTRHKNVDSIPEVEKCRGVNLLFEAPVDPQVKKASQWYESNDLGSDTKIEGN